jgi:hypothetical protein
MIGAMLPMRAGISAQAGQDGPLVELLTDSRGFTSLAELRAATDAIRIEAPARPPARAPTAPTRPASAAPPTSHRPAQPPRRQRPRPAASARAHAGLRPPRWYLDTPSQPNWKL